jgi:hypothetical protein
MTNTIPTIPRLLLTKEEVGLALGISRNTAAAMVDAGLWPVVRLRGDDTQRPLVPVAALQAWIERVQVGGATPAAPAPASQRRTPEPKPAAPEPSADISPRPRRRGREPFRLPVELRGKERPVDS